METRQAIHSFILDREASNLSRWTLEWYQRRLGKFCARYSELPETPDPLREFLRDLSCGDETKHGYFRALRALYNFLQEELGFPLDSEQKSPDANPIRKLKAPKLKPKVMRSLSLEEVHQLLNAPNGTGESRWHLRDQAIVTLLADNGVRVGEAVLVWDDVGEETLYVSGKTGEREVPILPETQALLRKLKAWNDTHFGPSPHVFLGKQGPLTTQGIREAVERAFKRAGLNGTRSTPHTLRHTFARNWLAEGGDPYTLQQILGHTTMTMVRRYVAMNKKECQRQHQRFSPVRTSARLAQGSLWGKERRPTESEFSRS